MHKPTNHTSAGKKLASLVGFCRKTGICKRHCRNKKPIKVITRQAKVVCPYTYELNSFTIIEQLELPLCPDRLGQEK